MGRQILQKPLKYTGGGYMPILVKNIIVLSISLLLGSDLTLAQVGVKKNDSTYKSCSSQLEYLMDSWNPKIIKNYQEIEPLSYELIDTLNDVNMSFYKEQIMDKDNYVLDYENETKVVSEHQLSDLSTEVASQLADAHDKMLAKGNKVYAIKVKLRQGIFYNYGICGAIGTEKIFWDNMFSNILLFEKGFSSKRVVPVSIF
ncbi:hypothetical protein [Fodinibius salsisoli]|uniref:Uncharacterized protein n=1 Tax=Fodinibius salsisoli TaxID=2820877 RepID=A0ABT3PIK2_9BACT|nr:hypothetical protein [Fodinibius salsisoli]MCW9705747.1 hypothetical protein [Fodinibius salsisoli]